MRDVRSVVRAGLLLAGLLLAGCATHTPYITYKPKNRPLSDTAVLSAFEDRSSNALASVMETDGVGMPCLEAGCPVWVRVLPGTHYFTIRYTSYPFTVLTWTVLQSITVNDMKPRHVYVVRYREEGRRVRMFVEDLGENPEYGITLLKDGNRKYHRVVFE